MDGGREGKLRSSVSDTLTLASYCRPLLAPVASPFLCGFLAIGAARIAVKSRYRRLNIL